MKRIENVIVLLRKLMAPTTTSVPQLFRNIACEQKGLHMKDKDRIEPQLVVEPNDTHMRFDELEVTEFEYNQTGEIISLSQEDYRHLFDLTPIGVTMLDMMGVIIYCNPAVYNKGGYTSDEFIGRHFLKIAPVRAKDIPTYIGIFNSIIRGKTPKPFEVEYQRKDGTTGCTELHIGLIKVDAKRRILVMQHDITDRKNALERLRFLGSITEQISDSVVVTDKEYRIIYANKAVEDLFGFSNDELVGMSSDIFEAEPNTENIQNNKYQSINSGKVWAGYSLAKRKDGSTFFCDHKVSPIHDEEGQIRYYLNVHRDITDLIKLQEERQKDSKLESIGVLAGGIAHDFNNLLVGILGNISLAKRILEASGVEIALDILLEAERASLQAKHLTQQLLTFAQGGALVKKVTKMTDLIRDSATFALRGSKSRCHFSTPDNIWPVEIDEDQLSRVIHNLVINADESMPEGGTITIIARNSAIGANCSLPIAQGEYVQISVEDQGVGIPKQHLAMIFDPFFSTKQKGSGLGLAIAYSIIRKHDGYITAESTLGAGTTVHIYLPASKTAISANGKVKEKTYTFGTAKILVMDDVDIVRETLCRVLQNIGYETEGASNGADTVELYKQAFESGRIFDVVILDLTVQGEMGGIQIVERLREIDPNVKAIACSGYSDHPAMANFSNYGFKGIISKPCEIEELEEVLHRVRDVSE